MLPSTCKTCSAHLMRFDFIALLMLQDYFSLLRSFGRNCRCPWSCVIFRIVLIFMMMSCQTLVQIPNRRIVPYLFSMKVYSLHSQLKAFIRKCLMSRFIEGLSLGFKACDKNSRVNYSDKFK